MRKIAKVAVCLLVLAVTVTVTGNVFVFADSVTDTDALAMSDVSLLRLNNYAEYFGFRNGVIDLNDSFILDAPRAERTGEISSLEGRERVIDTPLELALFS